MKQILFFSFGLLVGLSSCLPGSVIKGTIVLLNGTSSAGKTAILKALQEIYGDYIVANGDNFLSEYNDKYPLSQEMSQQEIKDYFSNAMTAYYNRVKELSLQGKNVFVDTVQFDDRYDYYCSLLGCDNVVKILVYCPPDVLIERIEMRNKSGDLKEKRSLNQTLPQFSGIYKVQESSDEMVIDRIQTSRINKTLLLAEQEARQQNKDAGDTEEEIKQKVDPFVSDFIQQFKLDTLDEIVLVPKHKWDLVVNCTNSPTEIARTITEYLKKKV